MLLPSDRVFSLYTMGSDFSTWLRNAADASFRQPIFVEDRRPGNLMLCAYVSAMVIVAVASAGFVIFLFSSRGLVVCHNDPILDCDIMTHAAWNEENLVATIPLTCDPSFSLVVVVSKLVVVGRWLLTSIQTEIPTEYGFGFLVKRLWREISKSERILALRMGWQHANRLPSSLLMHHKSTLHAFHHKSPRVTTMPSIMHATPKKWRCSLGRAQHPSERCKRRNHAQGKSVGQEACTIGAGSTVLERLERCVRGLRGERKVKRGKEGWGRSK